MTQWPEGRTSGKHPLESVIWYIQESEEKNVIIEGNLHD